jgi:hypothetical protein
MGYVGFSHLAIKLPERDAGHYPPSRIFIVSTATVWGTLLEVQLVEALRYKPEGHGFDSRWCQWNFSFT